MSDVRSVRLMVFDVDGVLTDGGIIVSDTGLESKRFHVRDGFAIKAAMMLGMKIGVLSGRSTRAVTSRVSELGIEYVMQGVSDKAIGIETLCQRANVGLDETAYLGDDVIDLPAMLRCAYPMAVADAVDEARAVAKFVTQTRGGYGAAREAIEHVLKAQGRWDELLERYNV